MTKNFDIFYSKFLLESANDDEYLRLASQPEKNHKLLQKIVDEAADAAGLTEVFRAVRYNKPKLEARPGYIVTFATRKEVADSYGKEEDDTTRYFINPSIAKEFPSKNGHFSKLGFDDEASSGRGWIVAKKVHDTGPWASLERDPKRLFSYPSDIYSTTKVKGNELKLSDPVTYDDNGDIIPLSQRFDSSKEDIRY